MSTKAFALSVFALALVSVACCAADFEEKWVMYSCSIRDQASTESVMQFLDQAKSLGVTHVLLGEGNLSSLDRVAGDYKANAAKIREHAEKLGITLVPTMFYIGYSGRYLWRDGNLAAGIPVKDAPFIARGGVAVPDPSAVPSVANGGFDEFEENTFTGWSSQDYPGTHSFVDTQVKHSGKASIRITNLDKLPPEAKESCRIRQVIKVEPFRYYRLTVWTRTNAIQAEREDYLLLMSGGRTRRHCFQNFQTEPTQDWTRQVVAFNTFQATEIELSVGASLAKGGTIWFDDLTVEPAGLLQLVRTEIKPFRITSADGSAVYEEGKDFEVGRSGEQIYWEGGRDVSEPAGIRITEDSRIKDGDKILVSYYHTSVIYDDQSVCSVQEPKILAMMEDQAKRVAEIWPTGAYFMNYDEIRIGGWEVQPKGQNLTCGQMLAQHVSKAVGFIRKYSPGAKVYVWTDMFDPHHNAYPKDTPAFPDNPNFYYLCSSNWDGAWEGLPKDVIMMNWNGTENAARSLKWFASRGHKQVIAGYYDGDPKESVRTWMKAAEGLPNVVGMMYTTWQRNYSRMPEFFKALDEAVSAKKPTAE